MKNLSKLLSLLLCLTMLLSLIACSNDNPDPTDPPSSEPEASQPTETENVEPAIDLGGLEFVMGDWWSAAEYEPGEPQSAWDQMVADYRADLEENYKFTFAQIGLQNMGTYNEVLINSFVANQPVCHAFQAETVSVPIMAAQGLLYDLSTLDAFDFENDPKWSQKIVDYFTINGKVYAARPSEDQPRLGIYFNKRLLEEAGVDPELPYDLQAAGNWTWESFEELCAKLTRDTNNDGVTDIYAYGGNDCEQMCVGIYGNGAMFVERDENGMFVDGTKNPAFEEGLVWAISLFDKGYTPVLDSSWAWDKAYTDFRDGKLAMCVSQTWVASSYWADMDDEIGYVMLPAGPKGHNCTNMIPTPIAIPACLDEETAQKVAVVIDAWYDEYYAIEEAAAMGITFRDGYYTQFDDSRAVDETITSMVTDPACQVYDSYHLIPNYDYYGVLVNVANRSATPAEQIEYIRPINQAAIDAANALFGN